MSGDLVAAVFAELDRLVSGLPPNPAAGGAAGVAVSGGGDSVALLIIVQRWARERGRNISAATVDHRLRPESAAEAAGVAVLCARLEIPHQTLQAGDLRAAGGNLSAVAREARFALLGGWARAQGLAAVLLGHTMDDQAETVLMRLARGSGVEGLSAMQEVIQRQGLAWLRPLLGVRREALREFLRAEGIGWVDDPTNEAPEYHRVKARRALAALAPLGIDAEGLARTAWHLQRQRRVLERAMRGLARRARRWGTLGEARLDIAAIAGDEYDTALRLFADTLLLVSGAVYRPRFRALSGILDDILSGRGAATTLSGCLIRPETGPEIGPAAGTVLICREPGACQAMAPARGGDMVWDRRWRVTLGADWPAAARLGALGEPGLTVLRAAARSGAWEPPELWACAPRAVRQTTPAVWSGGGSEPPVLLAAPLADFLDRRNIGPDCVAAAENIAAGELRPAAPPAYGRAGAG